jgi:hypothetical protein
VAGGATPLAYQWRFNNANISAATNSSYSVTNAQPGNAGDYSVIVANAFGSINSPEAALNVIAPLSNVIDVAFTSASVTAKTGFAATGVTSNDFWNTCNTNSASLPNLKFMNASASSAGLTFTPGFPGGPFGPVEGATNGASDPMYGDYLFSLESQMSVMVTNLNVGLYDVYLYGHGVDDDQNSVFLLAAGSLSYGSEATTNGSGWLSSVWQEGVQYVEFTNVIIRPGQPITITVEPGSGNYVVLSGLQIASINPPAYGEPFVNGASNQVVNVYQGVTITNEAYSPYGPVSFTLASNAPAGASITTDGIFAWVPICEQGSTTNLTTVWVTDSSSPPLSNSMTFSVIVNECVEVSTGSSVTQAGQGTCLPVNLFTTVGLTSLSFTLSCPPGFLTNWNASSTNSAIAYVETGIQNSSQPTFGFGLQTGQALQGASVIGSICLETLPGRSAFVPLVFTSFAATTSGNTPATVYTAQGGRVVVVGNQPLLEASAGANSSRTLILYGTPGQSITLLSTTNLSKPNSWTTYGAVTLTNLFQTVSLGGATNPAQFFQVVQP